MPDKRGRVTVNNLLPLLLTDLMMEIKHKPATTLAEVLLVTGLNEVIEDANDPFFTDFSPFRGSFKQKMLFNALRIDSDSAYLFPGKNLDPVLVFLAGMRGAGKSTELRRYAKEIGHPNGYLCIFCHIDNKLNHPHLEYSEILLYQLERLLEKLLEAHVSLKDETAQGFEQLFESRKMYEQMKGETPWAKIQKHIGTWREMLISKNEQAGLLRSDFNRKFADLAIEFNIVVRDATLALQQAGKAQEILFIIDGLEKTQTAEVRRRIIIDDSNRIRHIKANMLFTLPIELIRETKRIREDAAVLAFPFIKVREPDGAPVEPAIERFTEFVQKRIAPELFDSPDTIREAILYSGGSPRELLRLLGAAASMAEGDRLLRCRLS